MSKILTLEQIKACRERVVKLKKNANWPLQQWFNNEDFETALNTIEQLQTRLRKLYAGDLSPESRLNGYKVVTDRQKERIEQLKADNKKLIERIDFAIDYLPECPDKALSFLKGR